MSRNIKKLWRGAGDKHGCSFNPYSIDDWPLQYINSSQQRNTWDYTHMNFHFFILIDVLLYFLCIFLKKIASLFLFYRHDCGFFMLQNMHSYDSIGLVIFDQEDILNIRMTILYNWLVNSDFRIDIQAIFGVNPGIMSWPFFIRPNSLFSSLWTSISS